MIRRLILWMVWRTNWFNKHPITTWEDGKQVAIRFAPFFRDEYQTHPKGVRCKLPWWTPCNFLLHCWRSHDDGERMHDHPRWSITICLKGQLIEKTPWGERVLRPGSIVFRSTKYIHGFRVESRYSWKTWTLFIVGRRKRMQNVYVVKRVTETPIR
jgi:hypothetical protein